jgi:hypothetical protein
MMIKVMKYTKLLTLMALAAFIFAPFAFAQSADTTVLAAPTQIQSTDSSTTVFVDPDAASDQTQEIDSETLAQELTSYQLRVADPSTGFFTRIVLRAKIHELQNELNIQQALQ